MASSSFVAVFMGSDDTAGDITLHTAIRSSAESDCVLQGVAGCCVYDGLNMNVPKPASPKLGPVDLSESVAGEEDPGASLDLPPPERLPEGATGTCVRCGGSGKLAAGPCPDCRGTGKSASRP